MICIYSFTACYECMDIGCTVNGQDKGTVLRISRRVEIDATSSHEVDHQILEPAQSYQKCSVLLSGLLMDLSIEAGNVYLPP